MSLCFPLDSSKRISTIVPGFFKTLGRTYINCHNRLRIKWIKELLKFNDIVLYKTQVAKWIRPFQGVQSYFLEHFCVSLIYVPRHKFESAGFNFRGLYFKYLTIGRIVSTGSQRKCFPGNKVCVILNKQWSWHCTFVTLKQNG